ncbi:MAG: ATP-dependent RecD-like DNA helicase [Saprospiraceae bacterium]
MLNTEPLQLSDDFNYALDQLDRHRASMFITGKAGTGKSTLLRLFQQTCKRKVVVLAPTGIAALNVGGQTIHSFFGFPIKPITRADIRKRRDRRLYQRMEVLVIDEISMVRADMLDNIDAFLQINRDNYAPFGGVQVVFFGDLFQLPPVVSSEAEKRLFQTYYETPYYFSAKIMQREDFNLQNFELRRVYRQEQRHFIRLLDCVRTNRMDYDDLADLNERYIEDFQSEDFYITLSARNATVNRLNRGALEKIPLPALTYTATVNGQFDERRYPTDLLLSLKLSAQVMFIKNDPERKFVNGTIGKIVKLEENNITVLVEEDGKRRYIEVEKMEWEIQKYRPHPTKPDEIETETMGSFKQYPLKLAWALTVHKSQGKTFDKVIIDMGRGAFEHGQTYVALSRCRTLEGIVLKNPLRPRDVMVDERVVEYYETYF